MEDSMEYGNTGLWQFSGSSGQWYNYKPRDCCSVTSEDIERRYKHNPQGSLKFTVDGHPYILDFKKMTQTCCVTGATRNIRRLTVQQPGS